MTQQNYSTLDIVKILKVPRERLRDWLDRGFIVPSLYKAKKQGDRSSFSLDDVYKIGLFKYLIEHGGLHRYMAEKITQSFNDMSDKSVFYEFDKGVLSIEINLKKLKNDIYKKISCYDPTKALPKM